MKHPPAVLILAMAGGVAKAAVSQFVNHVHHRSHHDHEKPRQQRSLARQLTHQELEPLDHHITSIGSQCLAQGLDPVELARQASRHPQALSDIVSMMSTAAFSVTCKLVVEAAAMLLALTQRQWNILALLILLEALLVADYFWHTAEAQATQESRPLPLLPAEPSKAAPHVDERLSGVWHKVDELSDSQEPAANLLRLSGLARTATCLFKGMEFQLEGGHIAMKPLTKLPFLKVSQEVYALDGSVSLYGRRDLRKGKFCGYVKAQPNGGVNLYYKWEEPLAGHCCDEIKLVSPKDLHITTHLTVGTDSCTYRVVYRRASGSGASSKEEEVPLVLKAPEPGPLGLGSAGCDMAQSSTTSSSQAATAGSGRGSMSSSDHRTGSGMTEEAYDSCTVGSDVKRGSRGGHQVSPFARVCNM